MNNVPLIITAEWKGGSSFFSSNSTGGSLMVGSQNGEPAINFMQLLLVALAGCTGTDIISILQKKQCDLQDIKVNVHAKRADDSPRIWEAIHVVYEIYGSNIKPKDVEQAIKLSEEKYCSVGIMLEKSAHITSEYHLHLPIYP